MKEYINRGGGPVSLQNLFDSISKEGFEIRCVVILCRKDDNDHVFTHSSDKDARIENLELIREYLPQALKMLKQ